MTEIPPHLLQRAQAARDRSALRAPSTSIEIEFDYDVDNPSEIIEKAHEKARELFGITPHQGSLSVSFGIGRRFFSRWRFTVWAKYTEEEPF